jgi:hypothetical protein
VPLENELQALYLKWDPAYKEMEELGAANGFDSKVWTKYRPDKERLARSKAGQGAEPTTTVEDENKAAAAAADTTAANTDAYKSSEAAQKAEAARKADEARSARDTVAAGMREQIAAVKAKAAKAAEWHNLAMKSQRTLPPEAAKAAGNGWTKWALAGTEEKSFNRIVADPISNSDGVLAAGDKVLVLYEDALEQFENGESLAGKQ